MDRTCHEMSVHALVHKHWFSLISSRILIKHPIEIFQFWESEDGGHGPILLVISPVCVSVCVWVCGAYVVQHFNGTELHCAPSTCRVYHWPALSNHGWVDYGWRHEVTKWRHFGKKDIKMPGAGGAWMLRHFHKKWLVFHSTHDPLKISMPYKSQSIYTLWQKVEPGNSTSMRLHWKFFAQFPLKVACNVIIHFFLECSNDRGPAPRPVSSDWSCTRSIPSLSPVFTAACIMVVLKQEAFPNSTIIDINIFMLMQALAQLVNNPA